MSHQDRPHLHTNLQTIQAAFDQFLPPELNSFQRHGNATLDAAWLVKVALSCWGWTGHAPLNERVQMACSIVGRASGVDTTVSRQGLLKALGTCGEALVCLIIDHLAHRLAQLTGHWTSGGKVNVAVDGSKMRAPRTRANQQAFAADGPGRRRRRGYKSQSDASKAATVQLLMTVFWHLGTGLPLRWTIQGSRGSERKSVQEVLEQLPPDVRLIGDAEYVGHPLWSCIIRSGRSFLFRAGSNVRLLKNLGRYRIRDGYVHFWPHQVMTSGEPPLILRLIRIHNGRRTIFLVTDELDMSEDLACTLYRQRWGVEVFFRSVKQTCERSRLACHSPQNVVSELNWTLLGIWCALYLGKHVLHDEGEDLSRLSPVKVLRTFYQLVQAIHFAGTAFGFSREALAHALIADESHRTSSKRSRGYPRKKSSRQCGFPRITAPTALQRRYAKPFRL